MGKETVAAINQQEINSQVVRNSANIDNMKEKIVEINKTYKNINEHIKDTDTKLAVIKEQIEKKGDQNALIKFMSDNPVVTLIAISILASSGVLLPLIKLFI